LCNVPINCIHRCAEVLNKNTEDLTFKFAGLNHSHWQRVWDKEGNEITEELIGKLYDPDQKQEQKDFGVANIKDIKFNYEQVKNLGILSCLYHRYCYITDNMLKDELEEYKKDQLSKVNKKIEKIVNKNVYLSITKRPA